jgi:hypothetical protein
MINKKEIVFRLEIFSNLIANLIKSLLQIIRKCTRGRPTFVAIGCGRRGL